MKKGMIWLAAAAMSAAFTVPAMSAESIKIGVAGAHSGDLASYGIPSLNAAKVVIADVNAKGGINGKMLELVAQDDQCKPEFATNAATKLISDKVSVVMGPICSGPTKATLPLFNEAKIVAISPSATTPELTAAGKNPYFFRTIANDNAQALLTSDFMTRKLKVKKVAYLHDNGDYGKGFVDNNRALLEKAGVETVLYEAVTPDAVGFSAVVSKLRRSQPDILVFGGYQPTASKLIQQMRRDRVTTPVLGPDGLMDQAFIKMAGKAAEGVYSSYPKDTSTLAEYTQAREGHIKMFGADPGSFYYNAYAAMLALVNALEKSNSTDSAKIVEALHSSPVKTPLGTITFNKSGEAAGMALSIYQVKDGKFVELEHSVTLE